MQCLFAGQTPENLPDVQAQIYSGLFSVNNDFFYTQPITQETESYVIYRSALITSGVCRLRDRAIRGEITPEAFWDGYAQLKEKGLDRVISDGNARYQSLMSGGSGQ